MVSFADLHTTPRCQLHRLEIILLDMAVMPILDLGTPLAQEGREVNSASSRPVKGATSASADAPLHCALLGAHCILLSLNEVRKLRTVAWNLRLPPILFAFAASLCPWIGRGEVAILPPPFPPFVALLCPWIGQGFAPPSPPPLYPPFLEPPGLPPLSPLPLFCFKSKV